MVIDSGIKFHFKSAAFACKWISTLDLELCGSSIKYCLNLSGSFMPSYWQIYAELTDSIKPLNLHKQ